MTTAIASAGSCARVACRKSAKKYEMNATMPSAIPRGPNRRAYTVAIMITTNTTSLLNRCGASNAPSVTAATAGSGNNAVVSARCRGSWSLTATEEIIAITTPSSATVIG